jgi:hypothetical protein
MAITNPVVNRVFNDLDAFRDFCRFDNNGYVFDEAALYNKKDLVWKAYEKHQNYLKAKARGGKKKA